MASSPQDARRCPGGWNIGRQLAALLLGCALIAGTLSAAASDTVFLMDIKGPISVGAHQHFEEALKTARENDASLLIVRLDTPGGLVSVTREIISSILSSPIPIAVYVAPNGARAASAGTYITYAAHVAAMAPGTHLGAATPIALGAPPSPQPKGDEDKSKPSQTSAAEKKAINDAVAYLRTLAQLRHRNADWAKEAVVEAATLTATEAQREKVVDVIADNVADLLKKIDGRTVVTSQGEKILNTSGLSVRYLEQGWKSKLISVVTDPNIAFILFLIGIYGILFEFWSPGLGGPGIVGAISLIIALMGLSALPVSFTGASLLVLGIALLVAEALAPGFGILGLGGMVAFIAGALLLFDPAGADFDLSLAWPVIAGAALTTLLVFAGGLAMVLKSRRRAIATGAEQMIGMTGHVVDWSGQNGHIRVHGEIWAAKSPDRMSEGDSVSVRGRDGLTLTVDRVN
jgi:membrane-bound serine protease (ClpP class)